MQMLILRSSPASPFGRKVKIAAALCGLSDRIQVEKADTTDATDSLRQQNPLGKIPALILEDGSRLYDSRVILEWLDQEAGGGVIVPVGAARFPALVLQALADGIMDASILTIYEARYRPEEKHHQPWLDHQAGKVERALAELERNPPALDGSPHVGHITLACALGYRDFRFGGTWRADHPRLVEWLDRFAAAVPAYEATAPH
jgi:glutathione S-transferase